MMNSTVTYQRGDDLREIELRMIRVDNGWAVEINHKNPGPEADLVFVLRLVEAKALQAALGSFSNMLEWLWKADKR